MTILASSSTLDLAAAPQLFAGSAPITTNRAEAAETLAQYQIISIVGDQIVAWDPTASDGSEVAMGILANATDLANPPGSVSGQWAAYYTGGDFNHEALVWPVAINTLAERRAAFSSVSTIKISACV